MDKERIIELLEEIDLEKRVLEGAISSARASLDRIDLAIDDLNRMLGE